MIIFCYLVWIFLFSFFKLIATLGPISDLKNFKFESSFMNKPVLSWIWYYSYHHLFYVDLKRFILLIWSKKFNMFILNFLFWKDVFCVAFWMRWCKRLENFTIICLETWAIGLIFFVCESFVRIFIGFCLILENWN